MKKFHFLFALLFVVMATAHVKGQFTDDFSDGDFTLNPTWAGDDTIFEATTNILHLNAAPITGEAALSTADGAIENASWEFWVNLDFGTSSSNFARVYLVSDIADLRGNVNGYFVEIGGSTDEVSLYRQDGASDQEIIDGLDGRVGTSTVTVRVQVTRDATGNWTLAADSLGGTAYVSEGAVFDDTYIQSFYTGVYCKYTSTRSDKFWFDDFVVTGSPFVDVVPPEISSLNVLSDTQLDVYYTEPVQQGSAEAEANYLADNGLGAPTSAVLDGSDLTLVHLTFANQFQNGVTNNLQIFNVQDIAGNSIGVDDDNFVYFVPDVAAYRDVVINELFPDPSPIVGLPDAEFVEIFNNSTKFFDLDGWTLSDGSSTATLRSRLLAPGDHLIIVANGDSAVYINNVTSNTMGVSSMPSLNNAGDLITLTDSTNAIIDQVNYTDDWYQDANKDGGGWTLELINPDLPCSSPFNWIASNNLDGGTPGSQNSVYDVTPDVTAPSLASVQVINADSIILLFDEPLDSMSAINATYTIDNGLVVTGVDPVEPNYDQVYLAISPSMTMGLVNTITISGITDCSGNLTGTASDIFALPQPPAVGDVIINEVLFNPRTGGSDFVEIYNNSDKILSLQDWTLANFDDDTISNHDIITTEPILFFPGEYFLLTKDQANIEFEYPNTVSDRVIEMDALPSYNNDSSTVYLINSLDTISDQFSYDEDMQFGLLSDPDGVSLERIDFNRETNDATNWHSAAENVGWATPGFENSQYYPGQLPDDAVTLDPPVFSPDNDGNQDVLNINYKLDGPGYVGSITVYDRRGRIMKRIIQNELLATEGIYSWDGTMENREKARIGTYVIFFEIFDLDGNITNFKRVAVLGGTL